VNKTELGVFKVAFKSKAWPGISEAKIISKNFEIIPEIIYLGN
jgi:hypothetical protein